MAKFTKRSKDDKHLVTISLKEFLGRKPDELDIELFQQGDVWLAEVGGITTVFIVNRSGESLSTKTFPRGFRMPSLGKPVHHTVDNIYPVGGVL